MAEEKKSNAEKPQQKEKENLYEAEYLGSGTFRIVKPKRSATKLREARVHDVKRRARRHGR